MSRTRCLLLVLIGALSITSPAEAPRLAAFVNETSTDPKPEPTRGRQPAAEPRPTESIRFAGTKAGAEGPANGSEMKFCWCPAGTFIMGSPKNETERTAAEDQVEVTLTKGFWLGKYEVTQGQWEKVMGTTLLQQREMMIAQRDEAHGGPPPNDVGPSYPMYCVNHLEATEFCRRLTEQERQAGRLPPGWEYRLPTEAQWEYACRAGTKTATAFGDKLSSRQADFDGNFPYNGAEHGPRLGRMEVGGQYQPNGWGLCDMHGNASEWCRDWYQESLPGGTDPEVKNGETPVVRGGGWADYGRSCRSAARFPGKSDRSLLTGFRVAIVPSNPLPKPAPDRGRNGAGNGQPPGNPPISNGSGTRPGNPGNKGGNPVRRTSGHGKSGPKGNNGVGNGIAPQPPGILANSATPSVVGNPPINDGSGTSPDRTNGHGKSGPKGNNGVGNGIDPQPPGNPPIDDGPGTSPGHPGNKGGNPVSTTSGHDKSGPKGNNGVGNGIDPQPPGNPPINDGPGTRPGSPGNRLPVIAYGNSGGGAVVDRNGHWSANASRNSVTTAATQSVTRLPVIVYGNSGGGAVAGANGHWHSGTTNGASVQPGHTGQQPGKTTVASAQTVPSPTTGYHNAVPSGTLQMGVGLKPAAVPFHPAIATAGAATGPGGGVGTHANATHGTGKK